jgi:hypothetical protein
MYILAIFSYLLCLFLTYILQSLLQVKAMVEGRDRRPELGYKLAMELKSAMSDKSK